MTLYEFTVPSATAAVVDTLLSIEEAGTTRVSALGSGDCGFVE